MTAFLCTAEHPWKEGWPTPVVHEDVREMKHQRDGYPGGDIVTYECLNCKHRWTAELPQ